MPNLPIFKGGASLSNQNGSESYNANENGNESENANENANENENGRGEVEASPPPQVEHMEDITEDIFDEKMASYKSLMESYNKLVNYSRDIDNINNFHLTGLIGKYRTSLDKTFTHDSNIEECRNIMDKYFISFSIEPNRSGENFRGGARYSLLTRKEKPLKTHSKKKIFRQLKAQESRFSFKYKYTDLKIPKEMFELHFYFCVTDFYLKASKLLPLFKKLNTGYDFIDFNIILQNGLYRMIAFQLFRWFPLKFVHNSLFKKDGKDGKDGNYLPFFSVNHEIEKLEAGLDDSTPDEIDKLMIEVQSIIDKRFLIANDECTEIPDFLCIKDLYLKLLNILLNKLLKSYDKYKIKREQINTQYQGIVLSMALKSLYLKEFDKIIMDEEEETKIANEQTLAVMASEAAASDDGVMVDVPAETAETAESETSVMAADITDDAKTVPRGRSSLPRILPHIPPRSSSLPRIPPRSSSLPRSSSPPHIPPRSSSLPRSSSPPRIPTTGKVSIVTPSPKPKPTKMNI